MGWLQSFKARNQWEKEVKSIIRNTLNSITYLPDVVNNWQHPAETIAKGTGDCEDIAVLIRHKILSDIGVYPTKILFIDDLTVSENEKGHAVLQVEAHDRTYYICNRHGLRTKLTRSVVKGSISDLTIDLIVENAYNKPFNQ